jgi:hypothetical protein
MKIYIKIYISIKLYIYKSIYITNGYRTLITRIKQRHK